MTNNIKIPTPKDIRFIHNNTFVSSCRYCDFCDQIFEWGDMPYLVFPDICWSCLDLFKIPNRNELNIKCIICGSLFKEEQLPNLSGLIITSFYESDDGDMVNFCSEKCKRMQLLK